MISVNRGWLLGLYVVALVPRLALLAMNSRGLQFWEYETLAKNIAGGVGYVIPRFGHVALAFGDGNLYSFLAAAIYVVAGHQPMVLAVVQAFIASLAAPVILVIGVRVFGDLRVAAIGAGLAALHPGLLAYTTKLHPLGIDVLLLSLIVLWLLSSAATPRGGAMVGFALGVALMSRPTFMLAGIAAGLVRWGGPRRALVPLAAAVAVAALIAMPWITRNWLLFGRPLLISTSLEDVWKGNNPLASGSSYLADGRDVFSAAPPELRARLYQSDELALDTVFAQEVQSFVLERPMEFVSLVGRKFVSFWWLPSPAGLLYPAGWVTRYEVYAAIVYLFALVGAAQVMRSGTCDERRLLGVLAAVGLTLAVVHALAYVEGRHRWGIEPLLLLFTGRGLLVVAASMQSVAAIYQPWLFRRLNSR